MFKRKWMFVVLLPILLIFVLVPSSHAIEILDNETVVIKAGEVIEDDLIVFANKFVMDGTIKGDLIVFATTADINGLIEGDFMGGAQEITLNGTVQDDVRMGGTLITLGEYARIGDDLMAGAYSLESIAGSLVEGDMFLGVGQSRLAGDMANNLLMAGGGLELLGTVGGDVQAEVGTAADAPVFSPFTFMPDAPDVPMFPWGLTVGDQAQIGGDLSYTAPAATNIPANLVAGKVVFDQVIPDTVQATQEVVTPTQQVMNWFADVLRQLLTLFVIGALIVWLAPRWTDKVAGYVQDKPLPSLGWGLLAIAAFFVAVLAILFVMVLLALTLGALTFSGLAGTVITSGLFILFGLGLLFAFTVAFFAKIIVGVAVGRFIFNRFNSRMAQNGYWSMALGVLLIVILAAIPFIGPLFSLIVTLLGFGAFWQEGLQGWQQRLTWRTDEPLPEAKMKPA
jgi:cytoskeletal protein CcmA (bactofilin family)